MSDKKEPVHYLVAINRFIDVSLTFFNSLVALVLLTAPWYKLTQDTTFQGCALKKGTVLAPFVSGVCDYDTFSELPDGGNKWDTMHNYCIVYLVFALAISSLVGYESVVHGIRKWNNTNTLSFVLNMVMLIIQSMILIENGNVKKPQHIEDELATSLITAALVITCIRVPMLGYFMYHTYTYDRKNGGYFGTGSSMY